METDNGKVVLYVVRHGRTAANEAGTFRGLRHFPLDEKGIGDAEEARDFLKDVPIGSAYTSDLDRAKKTRSYRVGPRQKS